MCKVIGGILGRPNESSSIVTPCTTVETSSEQSLTSIQISIFQGGERRNLSSTFIQHICIKIYYLTPKR